MVISESYINILRLFSAYTIGACNPGSIIPYFRGVPIFYAKGIAGSLWDTTHLADDSNRVASLSSKVFAEHKKTRLHRRMAD